MEFFCLFFSPDTRASEFFGYFVLRDPIFPAKNKRIINGSPGAYKTCVQKIRVSKKMTSGPLCGKRSKITYLHRNDLVSSVASIFGVKHDLKLVLRSQFFEYLHETLNLYKPALEHLEAARSEKESVGKNSSYGNA